MDGRSFENLVIPSETLKKLISEEFPPYSPGTVKVPTGTSQKRDKISSFKDGNESEHHDSSITQVIDINLASSSAIDDIKNSFQEYKEVNTHSAWAELRNKIHNEWDLKNDSSIKSFSQEKDSVSPNDLKVSQELLSKNHTKQVVNEKTLHAEAPISDNFSEKEETLIIEDPLSQIQDKLEEIESLHRRFGGTQFKAISKIEKSIETLNANSIKEYVGDTLDSLLQIQDDSNQKIVARLKAVESSLSSVDSLSDKISELGSQEQLRSNAILDLLESIEVKIDAKLKLVLLATSLGFLMAGLGCGVQLARIIFSGF
jgi:hypothetical protein